MGLFVCEVVGLNITIRLIEICGGISVSGRARALEHEHHLKEGGQQDYLVVCECYCDAVRHGNR